MTPRLLLVPGLGDSGPQHWQTLWERKYGAARLRQDDPDAPTPEGWSKRLQEVIEATPGDLVLVGHSSGVLTIVHWARLYGGHERVKGALLVGPTDPEAMQTVSLYPVLGSMAPLPMQELAFPALVVASEDDPYVTFERAGEMAEAWGAELISAGEAGHISFENGGYGEWEDGEVLLSECLHAWTPPEISRF
ncbi:alpha/beta hydrolase [Deinococcus sp.]|uniref:RBBP9/YdeN family alpha/beta hydrolase n=1 Tax=Deinococcus sp. TaxID=47478 RepID=UPI00286DC3BA|nr:alpha/beta hydrolase [Deinococcus sp.]